MNELHTKALIMLIQNLYHMWGRRVDGKGAEFVGNKHTNTQPVLYISTDFYRLCSTFNVHLLDSVAANKPVGNWLKKTVSQICKLLIASPCSL